MTRSPKRRLPLLLALTAMAGPVCASGMTARDVTGQLFKAAPGVRPDLSGQDLMRLDLAGLDFKSARLSKANFFGADLSAANLSGADLSGANLDRVTLIATRFDGANLDGASLLRPSVFTTLAAAGAEAPSFKLAHMRGIKLFGRFTRGNFEGADLTGAILAPTGKTGFIEEIWRTELSGANFAGAQLADANFTHALLTFANMRGANLRNIILKDADLTGADLTGADLTGADVTGADLSSAKLEGVTGFETLRGLALARNADKVIR
ncbi:MAG: pentapeptide repeat-containing protein [Hyphomicrobium sp.]|nr:pentapeptide repeat-containing protein [Hyphomicrobium sp.]